MKEMRALTIGDVCYEIVDDKARQEIDDLKANDLTAESIENAMGYKPVSPDELDAVEKDVAELKAKEVELTAESIENALTYKPVSPSELTGAIGEHFDTEGTDTVDWSNATQDRYSGTRKVSEATPTYEELSAGTILGLVGNEPASAGGAQYEYEVTPTITYYEENGYCSLMDSGPGVGICGYVVYENNTLGIYPGTYLVDGTVRYMTVSGYKGYNAKDVLKEERLPSVLTDGLAKLPHIPCYTKTIEVASITPWFTIEIPDVDPWEIFEVVSATKFYKKNANGNVISVAFDRIQLYTVSNTGMVRYWFNQSDASFTSGDIAIAVTNFDNGYWLANAM